MVSSGKSIGRCGGRRHAILTVMVALPRSDAKPPIPIPNGAACAHASARLEYSHLFLYLFVHIGRYQTYEENIPVLG